LAWWNRVAWTLVVCAALAVLVRTTVKDRLPGFDLFYYGTPLPAPAVAILFAGCLWLALRRRARVLLCSVSALLLAAIWLAGARVESPCDSDSGSRRMLFWNVARGGEGLEPIAAVIRDSAAHVVGLVEARKRDTGFEARFRELLPEYTVYDLAGGLMLLTRGDVVAVRYLRLGKGSRAAVVDLALDLQPVVLILVDLEADPFSGRKELLRQVGEYTRLDPERPRILMGDFNTPIDSVWFDEIRRSFVHAFEAAGTGFLATWPRQLPLLTIDHVWVSRDVELRCARKSFHRSSDHAMISVDLVLPEPGPRSAAQSAVVRAARIRHGAQEHDGSGLPRLSERGSGAVGLSPRPWVDKFRPWQHSLLL
jgi:endonuclease/exonuclease/phosphatase family metal-dependent hydrolase